jgi:hypothetical protein
MLNLEAIKQRHLRPEQMEHRTFYEGHIVIDLAALVEEVEHLRGECHTLRLWCEEAARAENLNALDAQKERAAVVAWLRALRAGYAGSELITLAADAIERGEHRREVKE